MEGVGPGVVQERHTPLESKLIQDELGCDLEELTQIKGCVQLLADLVEVAVDADLVVELFLELIEFVLCSDEAFDLFNRRPFSSCSITSCCSTCSSRLPDASGNPSIVNSGQGQRM